MTKRLPHLFARCLFAGLFLWLTLIAISNTGLFRPNWPFELFASFMRQALVLTVLGLVILWAQGFKHWSAALLVLSGFAFWPLSVSKHYTVPDTQICSNESCYTAIFANLRRRPMAFNHVRKFARKHSADIVAFSELPPQMTKNRLSEYMPGYPYIVFAESSGDGRRLGSLMAIASKIPIRSYEVIAEDYPRYPRAFIWAQLGKQKEEFQFILTHPRVPLSHAGMRRRDNVLSMISEHIDDQKRFVIAGDFNMTPWASGYHRLPGRRAGDARLKSTWKDGWLLFGVPIDHFNMGSEIGLGHAEVLGSTGSDHRPVLIKFRVIH